MTRIGSLFSGYGGLEMGVQSVIGGDVVWHCEFDPAPSKILAHHWPNVPNLGDITQVDWSQVPPVDVLTGGFPCQDLSMAGRRAGMRPGTRSGLWSDFLKAIDVLRPSLVVIENVRGLLSGCAESDLEPCAGCVGDGEHRPVLRAAGRVLGDLAGVGYDAAWAGVRASDVGAPHGRFRVFVVAYPEGDSGRFWDGDDVLVGRGADGREPDAGAGGVSADTESFEQREPAEQRPVRDEPRASTRDHPHGVWGDYEPAIRRWERVLGRPAPAPTEPTGKNNAHRLSPCFVEWMMGVPPGHVTDVGLSRSEQLRALGNGVVPQQAAHALRLLLEVS